MENSKVCTKCGEIKDVGLFSKDNRTGNPLAMCKACDNERNKERYRSDSSYRQQQIVGASTRQKVRRGQEVECEDEFQSRVVAAEKIRIEKGLCVRCDNKAVEGKRECEQHLAKSAKRIGRIRNERIANGLCYRCGTRPPDEGSKVCGGCKGGVNKKREKNRIKCLSHYGSKCYCCGETIGKFLTIDHLKNDGHAQAEGGVHLYAWIIRHKFPDTFGVACFNCNIGRALNGGICPHKERVNGRIEAETPD